MSVGVYLAPLCCIGIKNKKNRNTGKMKAENFRIDLLHTSFRSIFCKSTSAYFFCVFWQTLAVLKHG